MELSLGQKGPVFPPPILDEPYQTTISAVSGWKDIKAVTHWHLYKKSQVDGIDFYVKDRELGHIHLNGDVHLATNTFLRKQLVNRELASSFPYPGYEDWILFQINNLQNAQHAAWLFRLNYDRLQAQTDTILSNEIEQYSQSNNFS